LNTPWGVAVDTLGNIYIADKRNFCIRKVTKSTGVITTVAGTGAYGPGGDGGLATATELYQPFAVAVDKSGNIYILCYSAYNIRQVTVTTGVITTVAGTGMAGYTGDGGPATLASLNSPQGIAVDASGNIYVADMNNNRIRMVTKSTGLITTVAGGGDSARTGDGGQAITAYLASPHGIAVDASGNLYISQLFGDRVRKVTKSTGFITTVVGTGKYGYSGDGGLATSATLSRPWGVAVDALGNIYVAEEMNHRIRKVTQSTGVITTVAGNGNDTYGGDGGQATSAALNTPEGVAVDALGNIYIADTLNNRIRMLTANELSTASPASVPTPTSAPAAVPISTISPSTVRTPTSAPSAVPISTSAPSAFPRSTSAPSAVPISTSAPSTVLTSTSAPAAVLTPTSAPSTVLTSTSAPAAVLTPTSAPSTVLTSTSAPAAVLTPTSAPSTVLTSTSAPAAVLTSTSAPSSAPATSLIATTSTSSSTALSSSVLPGVIGGVGGFLIIVLVVAVIYFCRSR
jgi:trimeric autotransporter adhesin